MDTDEHRQFKTRALLDGIHRVYLWLIWLLTEMSIELTPAERRALRARAHALRPVVMIGEAGLTPAVLKEVDIALKSHELIKIRVLGDDRDLRAAMIGDICAALDAAPVQQIGKMLVVFRPRPEPAEPRPAPRPRRKPKFRPKRFFQN
jgi:putative YhbY family RNA-binding protein